MNNGLGSPLPNYRWPDLSWIPLPVWVVGVLWVAVLVALLARALVRR